MSTELGKTTKEGKVEEKAGEEKIFEKSAIHSLLINFIFNNIFCLFCYDLVVQSF